MSGLVPSLPPSGSLFCGVEYLTSPPPPDCTHGFQMNSKTEFELTSTVIECIFLFSQCERKHQQFGVGFFQGLLPSTVLTPPKNE